MTQCISRASRGPVEGKAVAEKLLAAEELENTGDYGLTSAKRAELYRRYSESTHIAK